MAILPVQKPTKAGTTLASAAAEAGGDSFPNTGREYVQVRNNHATNPRTVTFDSPGTCSFELAANAAHDLAVVLPALTTKAVGPFPTQRFNDANQRVQMSYSDAGADITISVFDAQG